MRLKLEDIIECFDLEDINLNRRQIEALISIYDPDTSDLLSLDKRVMKYIIRHLFNKTQRERYYSKPTGYLFAEIVMSCVI